MTTVARTYVKNASFCFCNYFSIFLRRCTYSAPRLKKVWMAWRLGRKKINAVLSSARVLHTTANQVNLRVDWTRTVAKCTKMKNARSKCARLLFILRKNVISEVPLAGVVVVIYSSLCLQRAHSSASIWKVWYVDETHYFLTKAWDSNTIHRKKCCENWIYSGHGEPV